MGSEGFRGVPVHLQDGTCQGSGLYDSRGRGPHHPPITRTGSGTGRAGLCPALPARRRPRPSPFFCGPPGPALLCAPGSWPLAVLSPRPSPLRAPAPLPHSGCGWPRRRDFAPVPKSPVVGAASHSAVHPECWVLRDGAGPELDKCRFDGAGAWEKITCQFTDYFIVIYCFYTLKNIML